MKKYYKRSNRVISSLAAVLAVICSLNVNVYAANHMTTDSYSFTVVSDSAAPTIGNQIPAAGENNVPRSSNIQFSVFDDLSGVNISTIDLSVNDVSILVNGSAQTYLDQSGNSALYNVVIERKSDCEYVVLYDPEDYFD